MTDIIKLLKDNEKPFGLMSEEMQEQAKSIEVANFQRWLCEDTWGTPKDHVFLGGSVYRLRPDYAEKPEIVECEILLNPESNIWGYKCPCSGDPVNADLAHSCPGFRLIGFKFEDGTLRTTPIYYQRPTHTNTQVFLNEEYTVLHATHVLFRKTK